MTELDDDGLDMDTGMSLADELVAALAAGAADSHRAAAPETPSTTVRLAVAGGLVDVAKQQSIVIGRRSASAGSARDDFDAERDARSGERLVTVDHRLVSRRHLLVRVDGGLPTATDLHSRNGATVMRGGATLRLHPEAPFELRTGDVIETAEHVVLCEVVAAP